MPSQPNPPDDPIVQILIEAYRRGLAIRQNSQPAQTADTTPLNTNAHGEGRLCKDGENGNSRNVSATGVENVTGTTSSYQKAA
jgi:hypothetical protein